MSAKKNRADRDLNRDGFKSYPEEIPIYPTHEEFPANGTVISNCSSSFNSLLRDFSQFIQCYECSYWNPCEAFH
jgi:hypothetical protein